MPYGGGRPGTLSPESEPTLWRGGGWNPKPWIIYIYVYIYNIGAPLTKNNGLDSEEKEFVVGGFVLCLI